MREPGQPASAVADHLIQAGIWVVVFCAACGGLAAAGCLFGIPVSGWVLVPALALACAAARVRPTSAGLWIGAGGLLLSMGFALCFWDVSWDGQAYHLEGVDYLANRGWNPVWQPSQSPYHLWIDHYAKITWYYAAVLYRATGWIEIGKSINLAMAGAAGFLWAGLLMRCGVRGALAGLVAGAAVMNPVGVVQWTTFYVDGLVASAGLVMLAGMGLVWLGRAPRQGWGAMAGGAVLLVNAKFTGLVLAVVLIVAVLAGLAFWRAGRGTFRWAVFRREIAGVGAVCLLALVAGVNPYVTNTVRNGHPFYPLRGEGSRDFVVKNAPPALQRPDWSPWRKGVLAHGSRSTDKKEPVGLKNPFSVRREEWRVFTCADARIGGFGPLFPASVVLGLGVWGWSLGRASSGFRYGAVVGMLALAASVGMNPEWWWARYVPQMWWIPCVMGASGLLVPGGGWVRRGLGGIGVAGLLATGVAALGISMGGWILPKQQRLENQLERLRAARRVEIAFPEKGAFYSNRRRLEEAGVVFTVVDALPEMAEHLVASTTRLRVVE